MYSIIQSMSNNSLYFDALLPVEQPNSFRCYSCVRAHGRDAEQTLPVIQCAVKDIRSQGEKVGERRRYYCEIHARWIDPTENEEPAESESKHRGPRGQLSVADVELIREGRDLYTQRELAEMFGITAAMVSHIQRGRCYRAVGP